MLVFLLTVAFAAPCPSPSFTFLGQPDCVELSFDGAHTVLVNRCDAPLLVDASVLAQGAAPWIPANTKTALRDLSAFTLGLRGELFPVMAALESCEAPAPLASAR